MPKLTLSMIVKNEEKYLSGCLESVKDVADEIIIVDTGSTDKTIEIAEEFDAKVFHFSWINDFSAARNFALSKSIGEWILYLDADERLSEISKSELLKVTASANKLGVRCLVNSIDSHRNNSQMMKYTRLFKNDSNIKFSGKAHEQIESSLAQSSYEIIDSNIEIIHLGYDVPEDELKNKARRNLELLLSDYSKQETSYLAYQIANSYSILEDVERSNLFYSKALTNNSLTKDLRSICFLNLADYEMRNGNLENAKQFIDKGINENSQHTLLLLVGTQVYGKLSQYENAKELCRNALKQNSVGNLNKSGINQIITISEQKIIYQGLLLSIVSNDNKNFEYFLKTLKKYNSDECKIFNKLIKQTTLINSELDTLFEYTNNDNLELILKLLESYQHKVIKLNYLKSISNKFKKNSKFLSFYGSFLMNQNKNDSAKEIFEMAIELDNYDPSIILYLSSLYVKSNQFDKLIILLEQEELAAQNNMILQKNLDLLKEKLMPLLSKSFS